MGRQETQQKLLEPRSVLKQMPQFFLPDRELKSMDAAVFYGHAYSLPLPLFDLHDRIGTQMEENEGVEFPEEFFFQSKIQVYPSSGCGKIKRPESLNYYQKDT